MRRRFAYFGLAAALTAVLPLLVLGYVVLLGRDHYWPYGLQQPPDETLRRSVEGGRLYAQPQPHHLETDVRSLIDLASADDVARRRRELIAYIWDGEPFPGERRPARVIPAVDDPAWRDLPNLASIDRLEIALPYGLESIVYHFRPVRGHDSLVVYHQGHDGGFDVGKRYIQFFVERGYGVLALAMPLLGLNNRPTVDLPRFGRIRLLDHQRLALLQAPIRLFLEPVAVALNHVRAGQTPASTYMVGYSGGGWTTTLYAALAPDIDRSYPVAGSYPIHLRDGASDWGDFEQTVPALYRLATYPELYVLGAHGRHRKQLQLLNQYDPCCFAGRRFVTYQEPITRLVAALGEGEFDVYLDQDNLEHSISDRALDVIAADMAQHRALVGVP